MTEIILIAVIALLIIGTYNLFLKKDKKESAEEEISIPELDLPIETWTPEPVIETVPEVAPEPVLEEAPEPAKEVKAISKPKKTTGAKAKSKETKKPKASTEKKKGRPKKSQ